MGDSVEPRRSAAEVAEASDGRSSKARDASEVHNATTRVTIAWPFSQIKLHEASAELTDLAGILCDLVDALSDVVPEPALAPLRDRARTLRDRLR